MTDVHLPYLLNLPAPVLPDLAPVMRVMVHDDAGLNRLATGCVGVPEAPVQVTRLLGIPVTKVAAVPVDEVWLVTLKPKPRYEGFDEFLEEITDCVRMKLP